MAYTGLYNADGQIILNIVNGSVYVGAYSVDGNWNAVLTTEGTTIKGRHHPCGALWVTVTTDPSKGAYAPDGSMYVMPNSSGGYSPRYPSSVGGTIPLVVANRGEFYVATTTAAANSLRAENRKFFTLGVRPQRAVRVVYSGFYVTASNVETNIGNDQTVEAGFELVGSPNVTKTFTFNNASIGTIVNGVARYTSDWLYASQFGLTSFPANSTFFIRDRRDITIGQFFNRDASIANMTGEGTFFSDGASPSQVGAIGVMTIQTGGSTLNRDFGPICVEGLAVSQHDIAVLSIGDSLVAGVNDTNQPNGSDGTNGGGFIQRSLKSVNGRSIPYLSMGYAGTQAQQFVASMTKRAQYFPYCTHLIENYGTNDFASGGRTAAQIYADRQTIWTAARAGGVRWVEALPIFCRSTSTDSWVTIVNQTPSAGYETGGSFRDPMNANLATALSTNLINGITNINTVIADGTAVDKWVVTGAANYATADGTHPTPVMSALMAPVQTARAQTWV